MPEAYLALGVEAEAGGERARWRLLPGGNITGPRVQQGALLGPALCLLGAPLSEMMSLKRNP